MVAVKARSLLRSLKRIAMDIFSFWLACCSNRLICVSGYRGSIWQISKADLRWIRSNLGTALALDFLLGSLGTMLDFQQLITNQANLEVQVDRAEGSAEVFDQRRLNLPKRLQIKRYLVLVFISRLSQFFISQSIVWLYFVSVRKINRRNLCLAKNGFPLFGNRPTFWEKIPLIRFQSV